MCSGRILPLGSPHLCGEPQKCAETSICLKLHRSISLIFLLLLFSSHAHVYKCTKLPSNCTRPQEHKLMLNSGSSNGRGPRCAAWFKDYVAARAEAEGIPENMAEPQVYTLEGGIKGWVAGGPPYRAVVDGYDEAYWMQFAEVKTAGKRTVDSSTGGDEAMDEDGDDNQTKRRILGMKGPGGSAF